MFVDAPDITTLVQLLEQRRVSLYHACQLLDFRSYLQASGVPTRATLEERKLPFTPFSTDVQDRTNKVWDCAFFNLSDSGFWFHRTTVPQLPNAFGPVLLVFHPNVLLEFDDVAICLRSAGGPDFDRKAESLQGASEVDQLFLNPREHVRSYYVKSRDLATLDFVKARNLRAEGVPEISCSSRGKTCVGLFKWLAKVEVDPIDHAGLSLHSTIRTEAAAAGIDAKIWQRSSKFMAIYGDLLSFADVGSTDLKAILKRTDLRDETREYLQSCANKRRHWMYERFSRYLKYGTLDPMASDQNAKTG